MLLKFVVLFFYLVVFLNPAAFQAVIFKASW